MTYSLKNPFIVGGDFETDYDPETDSRFICQWAVSEGNPFPEGKSPHAWTGKDKHSFIIKIIELIGAKKHVVIYFHNLKYDASYIMDFIEEFENMGFTHIWAVNENRNPIFLSFNKGDGKNVVQSIVFRDSKAKINRKLKDIGKMLGVSKLLPPDSEKFDDGWSKNIDYEHTSCYDPDWRYVATDAWICARSMKMLHEGIDGYKFTAPTISGDAFKLCSQISEKQWDDEYKQFCKEVGIEPDADKTRFKGMFPPLPPFPVDCEGNVVPPETPEEYDSIVRDNLVSDNEIREAYWGGINYSAHRGKITLPEGWKVYHIDYHSMYPSQMKFRKMPYGKCLRTLLLDHIPKPKIDYNPEREVYITQIFVTKMKLKPGMNPWYHLKNHEDKMEEGLKSSEPVVELKFPKVLTVADIELEDLQKFYDMEFTFDLPEEIKLVDDGCIIRPKTWVYAAMKGAMTSYIELCYQRKEQESKEGRKGGLWYNYWKTLMNSVYGRMAMNPYQYEAEIELDDEGIYHWKSPKYSKHISESYKSYVPYSVFVCAWARHQLTDAWLKVGCENVIHSDTDSIVFMSPSIPDILSVTPNELDTWGNECTDGDIQASTIKRYVEGGVKKYVEWTVLPEEITVDMDFSKCVNTALAGIPKEVKVINGVPIPVGMWVQVLDNDLIITEDDAELGNQHYFIKSKWLRDRYLKAGLNPDDVNTMKLRTQTVKGGIALVETTFNISTGFRLRFR